MKLYVLAYAFINVYVFSLYECWIMLLMGFKFGYMEFMSFQAYEDNNILSVWFEPFYDAQCFVKKKM